MSQRKIRSGDDAITTITILGSFVAVVLLFLFGVLEIGGLGNQEVEQAPAVDVQAPARTLYD